MSICSDQVWDQMIILMNRLSERCANRSNGSATQFHQPHDSGIPKGNSKPQSESSYHINTIYPYDLMCISMYVRKRRVDKVYAYIYIYMYAFM